MCCNKSINIVTGSGSITTLYSANGTLLSARTVTMNGNDVTFNGAEDFVINHNGRLAASLYASGLDDSSVYPQNFLYTDSSGQFMSAPGHLAIMLPVATEASGTLTAGVNRLTPVNVSEATATVNPPAGPSTNDVFEISDSRANASTFNILIDFSGAGQTFHGAVQNFTMNSDAAFSRFRYLGGSIGWITEK